MTSPEDFIGLPYRLGADPTTHGATDCVHLAVAVLGCLGIDAPTPTRGWYRRIRRKDFTIYREQLDAWGVEVGAPTLGAVALLQSDGGGALGVYWNDGWLAIHHDQVAWCRPDSLAVRAIYCRPKKH